MFRSPSPIIIPSEGGAFGAMMIGLGLLNIVWGSLASWRTENGAAAWHYSFMADWGLVLCGLGLVLVDGVAHQGVEPGSHLRPHSREYVCRFEHPVLSYVRVDVAAPQEGGC